MVSTKNLLIIGVTVLIFAPVLVSGGLALAAFLAVVWLGVTVLGPEVWDLYKSRQMGASGMSGGDDEGGGRPSILKRRDN